MSVGKSDSLGVTVVSLIACVLLLWALVGRSQSVFVSNLRAVAPSVRSARVAAVALVPLYACQLALLATQSRLESATSQFAWMKTLPVPVFDRRDETGAHGAMFSALGFGLAVLETLAIGIVVLALRHRAHALNNRFVAAIACGFATLSVFAPVMSTTDPYEYVVTGILGFKAYTPVAAMFAGTLYEHYQKLVPLTGVIYGPLWVVIDMFVTALGGSMYEKIEALRFTNVVFVATCVLLLWRTGMTRPALLGFALNPYVWFYFVANPHADIEGLALLVAAYGFARRSKTWAAVLLIVAAGLIKLPFAIIAGPLLIPLRGAVRRLFAWGGAVALVSIASYEIPGPAYVRVLAAYAARRAAVDYGAWLIVASLIILTSVLLVVRRRGPFGAAWLFQQLAVIASPWYLVWGVPYALATGTLDSYLVALPLAASLIVDAARSTLASQSVLFLVVVFAASDLYFTKRRRTRCAPALQ